MLRAIAAALWALLFMLPVAAQQFGLRTYSVEHGLPSGSVFALCEDSDGYLWIGTAQGVARTDGLRFEVFTSAHGLPRSAVTALAPDPLGGVWLGFANGAVARWERGGIVATRSGAGAAIRTMVLHDGELWCAAAGHGVLRGAAARKAFADASAGLRSRNVHAMALDARGHLVAGSDSGLHVLQGDQWRPVPIQLPHPRVQALHADSAGLLVGTAQGFIELDLELRPVPLERRFLGTLPIALPDADLIAVWRAANGDLWFGAASGLFHLTKASGFAELKVMRESNGLGHDHVRALLQDRSGAVWAATAFGGITKHTGDAFLHFTDRDGLASRTVSALHRTPDGRLWMGTAGGGLSQWDGSGLLHYGHDAGLIDPVVLCLGEDASGFLLVGTAERGLFRFDGSRFNPAEAGLATGTVHCVQLDDESRCWIGTAAGLWVDPGDGRYLRVEGCESPIARTACNGDTLWAATANGLYMLPTRVMPWRLRPVRALPTVAMTSVVRDGAGNLWVGTEAHGVYRLKGHRLDSIGAAQGLANDAVEQLLLDAVQNLWVGTRQGVDLIELDDVQERVLRIVHHGANEGFIGIECFRNASLLDSDGALWFGTARGATRHDPRLTVAVPREPRIHLTDLRLFFERPDWARWSHGTDEHGIPLDLELPHEQNHLTFHFTGISLAYPEKVRYHYYLEGLDPEWSPITATDQVTYSGLPPGDYTFHVQARAASGTWNEPPIAYAFTIHPAFWQTLTFRSVAGIALVLAVLGFINLRTRRLRRDRERLERTVQQRTQELAAEKDRSEELLRNILPASTAEELKAKGHADARRHEHCTVLFSDFKGFTTFSSGMDSDTLVSELQHFFGRFDALSGGFGVEKIKTIGDAYMCAAGLPEPSPAHALRALLMAFAMLDAVERSNAERRAKGVQEWPIRIGLHSGPVVAGVVGTRKFAYDIWGDTVNLASRMEANSDAGRINISGPVYAQVMAYVDVIPRGPIKVKGKGEVQMYFAVRLKKEHSSDQRGWLGNEELAQALARHN